jgi:hypothetical protein
LNFFLLFLNWTFSFYSNKKSTFTLTSVRIFLFVRKAEIPSGLNLFIMDHLTIYIHVLLKYYRLARLCDARYEIKSSKSSYYIFLSLVEIYRKFYPISFRFVWFRFVSFRLISFRFVRFRFVAFRFYFVSHFTCTQLNKPQLTKNKQPNFIGIRAFDSRLYLDISRSFNCPKCSPGVCLICYYLRSIR